MMDGMDLMDEMDPMGRAGGPQRPFRPYCPFFKAASFLLGTFTILALSLALLTRTALLPVPDLTATGTVIKPRLLDRFGRPMTVTYENRWNLHDTVALHQVPLFLREAFVFSEDRRFFAHHGVDWRARLGACWQNLKALGAVRGASTITEQVVRMCHPRPRTVWSRWLEGFEAQRLERRQSKAAVLEWYLNQVPYGARRRGVRQAARYYFDRDLDTLSPGESLALVVMVRAPGIYDPRKNHSLVEQKVRQLARDMRAAGLLTDIQRAAIAGERLQPAPAAEPVDVRHFARYVAEQAEAATGTTLHTTLDLDLQRTAQLILDQRLANLQHRQVHDGALLVVDHHTGAVRAWVVGDASGRGARQIGFDAVRTLRQPGSTLKPFVYALALGRQWTPATLIDDTPLKESVLWGLHTYHNYSRTHYGPVSLREALASSLNIPAIRAIQYVGADTFLATLHELGIRSLDRHPDLYGDGLVLGNGAVTLFELVQAYTVLARRGQFAPLRSLARAEPRETAQVFSDEVASLMGHILSDPQARRLEFGPESLLDLPVQTAVKTGTSSGYRDAWAVGYDHRHVVGVWMGNLDNRPMDRITGATGPTLVLRALFAELNRHRQTAPLYFSRRLESRAVCIDTGLLADGRCARRSEWFIPGKLPRPSDESVAAVEIRRPANGLQMAMDPRIPDDHEAFEFALNTDEGIAGVAWFVDGRQCGHSAGARFLWPMQPGPHRLQARIRLAGQDEPVMTREVAFLVK